MHAVFERGKEAFKVTFGQAAFCYLFCAGLSDHGLHLFNIDVAVLVSINLLSKVCFEIVLSLELLLQEAVHFDKLTLNLIKLVGWDVLRIEHDHIIVENVTLHDGTEV